MIKRVLAAIVLAVGLLGAVQPAYAYDFLGKACSVSPDAKNSSSVCSGSSTDPITGQTGIIHKATRLVAMVAGVAAVIMVIISGIYFVTAEGDPAKVTSARNSLIGAVIGVVIVVAAEAILNFVLTRV